MILLHTSSSIPVSSSSRAISSQSRREGGRECGREGEGGREREKGREGEMITTATSSAYDLATTHHTTNIPLLSPFPPLFPLYSLPVHILFLTSLMRGPRPGVAEG